MSNSVYLAGPIQHAHDSGKGWRARVTDAYGDSWDLVDPMEKYEHDYSYDEDQPSDSPRWPNRRIMESDRGQIDDADAVLMHYESVPTWGTPREMEYVSRWGRGPDIPVVIQTTVDTTSAWMCDAFYITDTFDSAFDALSEAVTIEDYRAWREHFLDNASV